MTTRELIALLQTYPPDATVVYRAYSDYNLLKEWEMQVVPKEDKTIGIHNGRPISYLPEWADRNPGTVFVDFVVFPGN